MARTKKSRIPDLGRPEFTELEFGRTTHRVAEVEPMDVNGVRTMTIGTIAWGIIAIALLPFWGNLQDQGRTWWLWTAIAGLGLGLMGIEFCKRRRDSLLVERDEPTPAVDPEPTVEAAADTAPASAQSESADTTERPVGRRRRT